MTVLNRDLIPFIEVLAELGIDWLGAELIDGIRRGQEPTEEEHALASARQRARAKQMDKTLPVLDDSVVGEPLVGHRQLKWAADYVYARLEATLAEMLASLDNLDQIVASDSEENVKATTASLILSLQGSDVEVYRSAGRPEVEAAWAQLSELRSALDSWLTRNQSDTDQ